MKLTTLYQELEDLATRLGLPVVLDRGNFRGGICTVDGEEIVVLNKSMPLEQRARYLIEAIGTKDLNGIFIKPAVRNLIEERLESI